MVAKRKNSETERSQKHKAYRYKLSRKILI